jgi:DNA-binding transcriptional regulator YiaG
MTGDEIKAWRNDHGLTQEELAREVGVSWSTIAKWEGGQRSPNRFTLPLLERAIQRIEKRAGKGMAAA